MSRGRKTDGKVPNVLRNWGRMIPVRYHLRSAPPHKRQKLKRPPIPRVDEETEQPEFTNTAAGNVIVLFVF